MGRFLAANEMKCSRHEWRRGENRVANPLEVLSKQMQDEYERARQDAQAIALAEDKYVFFLLGVAAAAIAYGMQRISGASLHSWDALPWFAAVLSWGVSFWAGCWNRDRRFEATKGRICSSLAKLSLKAQRATAPQDEDVCKALDAEAKFIGDRDAEYDRAAAAAQRCFDVQFHLLVVGALLFCLWQINEMSLHCDDDGLLLRILHALMRQ